MSNLMNIKRINIAQRNLLNITTNLTDERGPDGNFSVARDESLLCSYALVTNNTAQFSNSQLSHFVNVPLTVCLSTHVKVFERSQFKVISDLLR